MQEKNHPFGQQSFTVSTELEFEATSGAGEHLNHQAAGLDLVSFCLQYVAQFISVEFTVSCMHASTLSHHQSCTNRVTTDQLLTHC